MTKTPSRALDPDLAHKEEAHVEDTARPAGRTRLKRLQWMGAFALAVIIAFAIYAAWPPIYRAGLPGSSRFIAGCQASAVIGLPVVAALVMLDCTVRNVRIPLAAWGCFTGSTGLILFVSNYHAATLASVIMAALPVVTAAAGVAWLIAPPRLPAGDGQDGPFPDATVLYRFYRADGRLLYVGITRGFDRRQRAHALAKKWWPDVARTEVAVYANRTAAARAEHAAIMGEDPLHNSARYSLEAHLRSAVGR